MPAFTIAQAWLIFRQCVAEAIGAGLLCLGAYTIQAAGATGVLGAFGNGLNLALAIWLAGPVSGGMVNPGVTLSAALLRQIHFIYVPIFWIAQVVGAIAFSALGRAIIHPSTLTNEIGMSLPGVDATFGQFFGSEIVASVIFYSTIMFSIDALRPASWTVGGYSTSIFAAVFVTVYGTGIGGISGCSVNPARTLGPAIINNNYRDVWVYIVAELLGSCITALLFQIIFCRDSSLGRMKAWVSSGSYDPSKTYADGTPDDDDSIIGKPKARHISDRN